MNDIDNLSELLADIIDQNSLNSLLTQLTNLTVTTTLTETVSLIGETKNLNET